MARTMDYKPTRFGLENSDAIEENDRILEAGRQQRRENREKKENKEEEKTKQTEQAPVSGESKPTTSTDVPSTPVAEQSVSTYSADIMQNARKPNGKKTENGITIYVPMEYYERIALMKMRMGVPIKDLALQAVIEFLDRNK